MGAKKKIHHIPETFNYKRINPVFQSCIRLAIIAVLLRHEKVEFVILKKTIESTDGNVTTHLNKLEQAGYVSVEKHFEDRKPVTYYSLTPLGRKDFSTYTDEWKYFTQAR